MGGTSSEKVPTLAWKGVLEPGTWPYQEAMPCLPLAGIPRTQETLLFHRASKTLLVVDLVFNLQKASGFGSWAILSLFGTYRRLAVSKLLCKLIRDRQAFRASLNQVLELDFENLVPTHGEMVLGDAKDVLRRALVERQLIERFTSP